MGTGAQKTNKEGLLPEGEELMRKMPISTGYTLHVRCRNAHHSDDADTIRRGTAQSHNQGLVGKMFREGDPAGDNALSARETLGPSWQDAVNNNRWTCLG